MSEKYKRISAWIVPEASEGNGFQPISEAAEEIDATSRVLTLSHAQLVRLKDSGDIAEQLFAAEIEDFRQANGLSAPFRLEVVDSVLNFFDVDDITSISDEMLAEARHLIRVEEHGS